MLQISYQKSALLVLIFFFLPKEHELKLLAFHHSSCPFSSLSQTLLFSSWITSALLISVPNDIYIHTCEWVFEKILNLYNYKRDTNMIPSRIDSRLV